MKIIANDGEIIVEGKDNKITNIKWANEDHLSDFITGLYHPRAIAGTYYPESGTMEAALASLSFIFYNRIEGKYYLHVEDNDLPEIPQPGGRLPRELKNAG